LQPTRLGTDEARRVHRAGRHRRRRRPDGAPAAGRHHEEQPDEAADDRRQQAGGAGAEGFLAIKDAKGDPNKIIITLSNLFTTPLATGVPVQLEGSHSRSRCSRSTSSCCGSMRRPYKTAQEYLDAVAKAGVLQQVQDGRHRVRSKEAKIITVAIEKATGPEVHLHSGKGRRRRLPCRSSGTPSTRAVNNPIEAVAHWRAGSLAAASALFDDTRIPYK
jgi:hypothetical protein